MGIDISSKMIFGASYDDLGDSVEDLDEMLDEGVLEYASPYYDAPRDEWIVGVEMPREYESEVALSEALRKARLEFEELTDGAIGRIVVTPHVF